MQQLFKAIFKSGVLIKRTFRISLVITLISLIAGTIAPAAVGAAAFNQVSNEGNIPAAASKALNPIEFDVRMDAGPGGPWMFDYLDDTPYVHNMNPDMGVYAYATIDWNPAGTSNPGSGQASHGTCTIENIDLLNEVAGVTLEIDNFVLAAIQKVNWGQLGQSGDHRVYSGGSSVIKLNGVTKLTTINSRISMDVDWPAPTGPGDLVTGSGFGTIDVANSDPDWVDQFDNGNGQVEFEFDSMSAVVQGIWGAYNTHLVINSAPQQENMEMHPVIAVGPVNFPVANIALNVVSFTNGGLNNDQNQFFANQIMANPVGTPPAGITEVSQDCYWELGTVLSAINTDITFDLSDLTAMPSASNLRILKRGNAAQPWAIFPDQTVVDDDHIRANGVTTFSEFALGETTLTEITWATRAPMPAPRFALGVVTAGNGNIYAIGGWYNTAQSTVYEYNPVTNVWSTKAPLLAQTSSAGVAAANGGKIYVLGGYPDGSTPIATVQEYNPTTNTWSYKASMSTPRYTLAAATAGNGKIYAFGGTNINLGPVISTVEEFDPVLNTWATRTSMPTARRYLAAVAASNGKIYAIGGINSSGAILATVEEYNPITNTWAAKSPMSSPRFDPAAVAAPDGKIYVMGGYNEGPGSMATVEAYDPATDTWTPQTSMPTQRHTFGAAASNGKFYAMGGQTATGTEGLTAVVEEATISGGVSYWKFDETSGTVASDTWGTNNGTLVNSPAWVNGKSGNALSFDGINDYVTIPDSANWDFGTGNFTIGFWVNPSISSTRRPIINNRGGGGSVAGMWAIEIYNTANVIEFHSGTEILLISTESIPVSTWTHVTFIRNNGTLTVYLNGVSKGSAVDNTNYNTGYDLHIADDAMDATNDLGGNYFNGVIDEVKIYNRALTANEVRAEADLPTTGSLTMAVNGNGAVSPAIGAHVYPYNEVVNITATPASGYEFMGWTGNVSTVANVNAASTTVTMNGTYSITANFVNLNNWSLHKTINITGSTSPLTDYQVKVPVSFITGNMNSDFSDVRFRAADGTTVLNYWLESAIASTSSVFWVKVPSIPTSGTQIRMYYGNHSATSTSDFQNTFISANSDFEADAADTTYDNISLWDHISWKQNDAGTHGTVSVIEQLNTSATRYYSNAKSVYSWVQNQCPYDNNNPDSRRSIQQLYTEDNYRVVTNSSTLQIWRTEVSYTAPSRWYWWFGVQLSDGLNTQDFGLYGRAWGNGEGVPGNLVNTSDLTAIGADGQTWYRHSITIPAQFDKSNLTVKVYHVQDSWDHGTAESSLYYDLVGNIALRKYVPVEPVASFVVEPIDLGDWTYTKSINISGSVSQLTDYQVKVPVTFVSGKMNADFSDILFTAVDGTTFLSFWRESYTDSTSAVFWVKVPSIPTSGTQIYMYYGNPGAESTSNGENTFIFFDDYSTNKLTQYTNQYLGGQANGRAVSIQNGMLANSDNGNGDEWFIFTKNGIQLANLAAEIKLVSVSPKNVTKWQSHFLVLTPQQNSDANDVVLGYTHDNNTSFPPYLKFAGGSYSDRTWDSRDGTGYTLTIAKSGNTFKALVDGEQYWSFTNSTLGAMSFYAGTYDCDNYLVSSTALYDDFRIRNYALPEPVATVGTEEAVYPVLTMAVNGSGTVTPAAGAHDYEHGDIVTISAAPAQGWQFLNWTGDTGTVADVTSASTTVTMNTHYTITANFIQKATNWYPGWGYRKALVIDHTKVSNTNQTNFPVLISRTDNDLRAVVSGGHVGQTDGGDILFTAADGTTKLSHEIEKYVSSTGEVIVWVKIPVLSASADTIIYLYYGNAAAANQWAVDGSTWDSSYKMVQHMEETSGTEFDSTSHANNGTPFNGIVQGATSIIGGGVTLDGSNDYIDIPHSASLNQSTNISVDFWVKAATTQSSQYFLVIDKSHGYTDNTGWAFQGNTSNSGKLVFDYMGETAGAGTSASILDNTWHHIYGTFDGAWMRMYVDGILTQSGATTVPINTNTRSVEIGAAWGGGSKQRFFNGSMDEVRISDVARSADWVKTQYNNQSLPGTFYASTAEEGNIFNLTISVNGNGTTSPVAGTSSYPFGTVINLTATPIAGNHFVNWTGNVSTMANINSTATTITTNGNYSITANFAVNVVPTGGVSWWKFDETSGTTAVDTWAGNDGTLVPGKTNVLLGKPVTAANNYTPEFGTPGLITDGVFSGNGVEWYTNSVHLYGLPWFLSVDIGSVASGINRVLVQCDHNEAYTIEYSIDGTNWTVLYVAPYNPNWGLQTRDSGTISEVSARYIRISATGGDSAYSVSELQVFGNPTNWVTGKSGNALSFNGTSDYVQALNTIPGPSSQISLEAWVKVPVSGAKPEGHILEKQKTLYASYVLRLNAFKPQFILDNNADGTTYPVTSAVAINDNLWHHIAGTYDGTTMRLYVDGVEVTTGTAMSGSIYYEGSIGPRIGFHSEADTYFSGLIDEVKIFSRALTANEVRVEAGLVPQYTLTMAKNGSGTVTPDVGPHTYDSGAVVDLTAAPADGYRFVNWTGDTATITDVSDATTTITMNGNYTITANFILTPVHNITTGESFTTIQAAIDDVNTIDGHTITVDAGTYTENIDVTKGVTIRSSSGIAADTKIIAANTADHVFDVTHDNVMIDSMTIYGVDVSGSSANIKLNGVSACVIRMNNIGTVSTTGQYGLLLYRGGTNLVTQNNFNSLRTALRLEGSPNNNIEGNHFIYDELYDMYLTYSPFGTGSNGNMIVNNNCTEGSSDGIYIHNSNENIVHANTIENKVGGNGIDMGNTQNSIISRNVIHHVVGPFAAGIHVGSASYPSQNNTFFYNSLHNNTTNVLVENGTGRNTWNSPTEEGYMRASSGNFYRGLVGNYYDTYTGIDTNGDGIGETAYNIVTDNPDLYPLVTDTYSYVSADVQKLTINSTDGGTVTQPGTGEFLYQGGSVVNITAGPNDGYRFVNWTGDVDTVANVSEPSTTMVIQSDVVITANFAAGELGLLAVSTLPPDDITHNSAVFHGSIANLGGSPQATVYFQWGTQSTKRTNVDNPYQYEEMVGTITGTGTVGRLFTGLTPDTAYYYRIKVVGYETVYGTEVTFRTLRTPVLIALMVTGDGSTIPQNGPVTNYATPGTLLEIRAIPAEGWVFTSWDGDHTGTQNPVTITVADNDMTITANFVPSGTTPISNIKNTPQLYEGYTVTISGQYRGWESGHGVAPITRSDWVLQDATGDIYITGSSMNFKYPADVGNEVTVTGVVQLKDGVPYIKISGSRS